MCYIVISILALVSFSSATCPIRSDIVTADNLRPKPICFPTKPVQFPNEVIANNCSCVKTVLRPKLVTTVSTKKDVKQFVQIYTRPVIQKIQYQGTPVLPNGPVPTYSSPNSYSVSPVAIPCFYGSPGAAASSYVSDPAAGPLAIENLSTLPSSLQFINLN